MKEFIKLRMTFRFYPIWDLPVGISPMVFMGEICDRKVLHYMVFLPKLMFDPLFVKFFPENNFF